MVERPEGWNEELYNKLSYEYLIECAKNGKIAEWNQAYEAYLKSEWERLTLFGEYDKEKNESLFAFSSGFKRPDFRSGEITNAIQEGANFIDADLDGADFSSVHLEGANFSKASLKGAYFRHAHLDGANFIDAHLEGAVFSDSTVHLKRAYFRHAHLDGANFIDAHLEGADFSNSDANFKKAYFHNAHLEKAVFNDARLAETEFIDAYLEGAKFRETHLDGADFFHARLEGANFSNTSLKGAEFVDTRLQGANFNTADIEGSYFNYAILNGETLFTNNTIDDKTDFTGASLSSARIDPELRTKLERNIRQIRWEEWYKDNKMLEIPARVFWKISDYGNSTCAILITFLLSNFVFMMFYLALREADLLDGAILSTGNLSTVNDLILAYMQTTLVPFGILGIDLTTLSLFPVFIIFVQVIFGYTILAALVTRMAIMFQNLSP